MPKFTVDPNHTLRFDCSEDVHPSAKMGVQLMRTLRIPDDGKEYPLPPGIDRFPVRSLDGPNTTAVPMHQSEALWLHFDGQYDPERGVPYPFAVKVSAGMRSAITGDAFKPGLQEKDYCTIPEQPWLDGFVVEAGTIRQFVAMPLGHGYSAEEQITGKAEFGGIQIEVFPMKRDVFEQKFPVRPPDPVRGIGFGDTLYAAAAGGTAYAAPGVYAGAFYSPELSVESLVESSMGLGAGGSMKQQVYEDPHGLDAWDTDHGVACFIHLTNSAAWRALTGEDPPQPPITAETYSRYGFPWFDYYTDAPSLEGTHTLRNLKSVASLAASKGTPLPDNQPIHTGPPVILK